MNPKLLPCLALVLYAGLFGCSTVPRQPADTLDMAAYQIEPVRDKTAIPFAEEDWTGWQNFLTFSNSNIRIPLARSATAPFEDKYGFDPASLKLRWLKPDELLWISWTTFYHGTGGHTYDGNVIYQIHGGQGRELFRDHIESVAKGGWASQDFKKLKMDYNDADRTFQFTRHDATVNGGVGLPDPRYLHPFTDIFTNDSGEICYRSEVDTVDTWQYQLAGSQLKFLHGTSAVDIGADGQPVEEIVKGFHVTHAALESMNPGIRGQATATGIILLNEKTQPYAVSSDDGLSGD